MEIPEEYIITLASVSRCIAMGMTPSAEQMNDFANFHSYLASKRPDLTEDIRKGGIKKMQEFVEDYPNSSLIQRIKRWRELTGASLKDSKEFIEQNFPSNNPYRR